MKKVITTAHVLLSTQNQVKSKKKRKKCHHVPKCLMFPSMQGMPWNGMESKENFGMEYAQNGMEDLKNGMEDRLSY